MVEGKIEPGEWSDTAQVKMPNDARLYLKVPDEFVYVAVQFPASRWGFTDLYLASAGGSLHDLHASAKLGKRELHNDKCRSGIIGGTTPGLGRERFQSQFTRQENLAARERS